MSIEIWFYGNIKYFEQFLIYFRPFFSPRPLYPESGSVDCLVIKKKRKESQGKEQQQEIKGPWLYLPVPKEVDCAQVSLWGLTDLNLRIKLWSKQARKSENWPAKYWVDHTTGNEFLKGMDVTQSVNTKHYSPSKVWHLNLFFPTGFPCFRSSV